jgi:Na+-driven multidrug efflux pump
MLYYASNMFVGIQQLPLQLFRKMNRLSWSLIVARLSQLAVLLPTVYLIFRNVSFENEVVSTTTILAFCCVIFSVVASSI